MRITVEEWRRIEAKGRRGKSAKPLRKTKTITGFWPPTPVKWESVLQLENGRTSLTVKIDGLRLISELNRREHHMVTHKRKSSQQEIVRAAMRSTDPEWLLLVGRWLPMRITITRLAPRLIVDDDNRISSAKHTRDQVARELGVDDGDKRIEWIVDQERRATYGVRVSFERKAAA